MPRIKLTKPGFENFTGHLLGVQFIGGVSAALSQQERDIIAASQGGVLIDDNDEVIGGASSQLRWNHISKPADPRDPYLGVPVDPNPEPEPEEEEEGTGE